MCAPLQLICAACCFYCRISSTICQELTHFRWKSLKSPCIFGYGSARALTLLPVITAISFLASRSFPVVITSFIRDILLVNFSSRMIANPCLVEWDIRLRALKDYHSLKEPFDVTFS
jgi:hypothetical protein